MNQVNQILRHPEYLCQINKIAEYEKEREFCRHDTTHFLDVARIAWIINKEEQYNLNKRVIYAAALLHDIGRWQQYETGEDHAKASGTLAFSILKDCAFSINECEQIISAIASHRESEVKDLKNLNGLLYRADKLSRPCYFCKKQEQCNWKGEKKNLEISI